MRHAQLAQQGGTGPQVCPASRRYFRSRQGGPQQIYAEVQQICANCQVFLGAAIRPEIRAGPASQAAIEDFSRLEQSLAQLIYMWEAAESVALTLLLPGLCQQRMLLVAGLSVPACQLTNAMGCMMHPLQYSHLSLPPASSSSPCSGLQTLEPSSEAFQHAPCSAAASSIQSSDYEPLFT